MALETVWQDVRYSCRVLGRQPGFAIAAILTLAAALGANGAMFSVMDAVLLRPLPFKHSEQLVFFWETDAQHKRTLISPSDLDDWRKAKSFAALASLMGQSVNLTGVDQPARLAGAFVSPEYFRILGVDARHGRTFSDSEGQAGGERVAVLSYGLWQERFGGDASSIGRSVILNGEPFTVVGIMPQSFEPPFFKPDVFVPSRFYPGYTRDRARQGVLAIGRLNDGVSFASAKAELDGVTRQLANEYPETNRDRGALMLPVRDVMVENVRPTLVALAAAVGCLLLIACANVANLLLSKAAGRRQEMSLRVALGAGRLRLVRQLLTESMVLALSGALLGVGIAYALARYVSRSLIDSWPGGVNVDPSWKSLGFMAAIAVITAAVFGLAPALMARRGAGVGFRALGEVERTRLRSLLAIGQVALALVMLIGSGLMMESLRRLLKVDTGFDGNVLTLEYRLPEAKYPKSAQQAQFHDDVVTRVGALPGVESAGIVRGLPFSGNGGITDIGLPDRAAPPAASPFVALYNAATPTYFATVHIPLLEGRTFTAADDVNTHRVVVVSEGFVRRYWPGLDALGRQVLIPSRDLATRKVQKVAASVVGVVGNVRHDRLDEPGVPQLYVPYSQDPLTFATLVVRTRGSPMDRVREVQKAVWSLDREQPMWKIRTLASLVDASLGQRRLLLAMLGAFSGIALLLAALGLYGVMSYQVTQRTAEMGIRVALGARPGDILAMVLRSGLALAAVGLMAGAIAAPLLTRLLASQLFGVGAVDLPVYLVFGSLLLAVSAIAVLLPAWRATRLDPMRALRSE